MANPRRWKSPKVPRHIVDAPDDEYIARLRDAALWQGKGKRNVRTGSMTPERDATAVLFLTLTGARSGEAQKVRIRDVRLESGRVLLRKTKNGKSRQVMMPPVLVAAIRALVETRRQQGASGDDFLFGFKTRFGIPQMIRRTRKRAGLPHYRPHDIGRHAFATRLLYNGASLLDVQKAGGWDSARMVSDHYAHLSQEHVDKIVSGVNTDRLENRPPAVTRRAHGA
jgi:integrase